MKGWFSWWSRLRDVLFGSRLNGEIDDELRFHVDEEVEAGRRLGLTPSEARRAAYSSLGGSPTLVRERIQDARGMSWVDDLRRDVRQGLRLLRRNPVFTLVVLSTLALSSGAAVTAFSITDAWLLRPLGFPSADRLVVAFAAAPDRPTEPAVWMPYRAYISWKESARSFSSLSAAFFQEVTWRGSDGARSLVGMRVTPEFFDTLGLLPMRGLGFRGGEADGPRTVVLSYGFWQTELGGADAVLGTSIELSEVSYTVVGIMPRHFDVRLLDRPEGAAFWTLLRQGDPGYQLGGLGPVAIVGRLRAGADIQAAQAEVASITRQAEAAYPVNFNQFVVNLSSLQADNTRTVRATLVTVLGATLCLVLIAAMNVGALLLGRGLARRGEVAVRHALGAGRSRLARQFLTESLMLSAGGVTLGVGLSLVAIRLFLVWNPLGTLPANAIELNLRVWAAAGSVMVAVTAVSGLVPALRMSAVDPAEGLRAGGAHERVAAAGRRVQRAMLVAQIAASVVLLVCAALLARTFLQLRAEPLGFASDLTVATVVLPEAQFPTSAARNAFARQVEERLAAMPGVGRVAAATAPPLVGGSVAVVNTAAQDAVTAPRMSTTDVTNGFFETLEIPVLAGRAFDGGDQAQGVPVVVLDARAATALFGGVERAVGQRLRLDAETWREVVGVVGDVRTTFFNTLAWRTDPHVYRPAAQAFSRIGSPAATAFTLFVHIRSGGPLPASELRQVVLAAGPRAAMLEMQRVPAMVTEATKQPTLRMTLLLWFGGLSLLLAAMGVYGLVTQTVTDRLREVALRLALGAEPGAVVARIVRGALASGAVGLAIGVVAATVLGEPLAALLYGVRSTDGVSLAAAAGLLLGVTGLAAWVPARRAARLDPARVLRGN